MQSDQLVLGIDGGGTKTVACLAPRGPSPEPTVLARGLAGPSNPQAIGFDGAVENLDRAIAAALTDAKAEPGPVAAAVLGLAGSDRDENRQVFERWAHERRLARRFRVVHDALPVLIAGSAEGWGVALICGTGSLAFGQSPDGRCCRAGGWGYLLGDEGSGYWIARAGLRAAAQAADGRGPDTQLLDALLKRLELSEPEDLIPAVYRIASAPAAIAALAEVVTETSGKGDTVARAILNEAAADLAGLVAAAVQKLDCPQEPFPLALAGGVLLGSKGLQRSLHGGITARQLQVASITSVGDPVLGAVKLAQSDAEKNTGWQ